MELKVICKRLITQDLDENITEGEYGADIVGITVPRMYGNHDLSLFSFRLTAISKLNECVAEQVLSMDNIAAETIHLLWTVTSDFTAASGEVTLILAGIDSDNTVQIKFISQPVTINDDCRLEFIESPTILEQAYNQVQLEVQKAIDAAERAEEAASQPVIIPVAAENEIGGILSGGDISVDEDGTATVNSVNGKTIGTAVPENAVFTDTVYTLPVASSTKMGGVKSGNDITVSTDGFVTVNSVGGKTVKTSVPQNAVFTDTVYTLPKASANTLGGVKIDNSSIVINSKGIISATGISGESKETVNGNSSYTIENAADYPLLGLNLYGKSTQDGTPTPENPVDIVSVGDNGNVDITVNNGDKSVAASITSSLPLCGIPVSNGGNYTDRNGQQWVCDELIYNVDGTGKIIKRIAKYIFTGAESNGSWYLNSTNNSGKKRFMFIFFGSGTSLIPLHDSSIYTGSDPSRIICDRYQTVSNLDTYKCISGIAVGHSTDNGQITLYDDNCSTMTIADWKSHLAENPITVVYQLNTSQEIELTAAEMSALRQLQTFEGVTNIYNSRGAEMAVEYCTNKAFSACVLPLVSGLQKQIDELNAAILSMGSNV